MRPASSRNHATRGIPVLVSALLLASCGSTAPSPSPAAPGSGASSSPPSSRPASPGPDASSAPAPSPLPGFVTKAPPAADAAWASLTWRKLGADDPLALVRSMIRLADGGFMAVGDPAGAGDTSMTPVWLSSDGATWQPSTAPFGPAGVVITMGHAGDRTIVLTLQGGPNSCTDNAAPGCWTLGGPLTSWTSAGGTDWTSNPGPDLSLAPDCDTCGVTPPIVGFGTPGAVVLSPSADGVKGAISQDGVTWEALPSGTFPADFQVGDIAAIGDGFVAVGDLSQGNTSRAAAFRSADGRSWRSRTVPVAGSVEGSTIGDLLAGTSGLVAMGSDTAVPGRALWWTSPDGSGWTSRPRYGPLGVWNGEDEGSGLIPDGNLVADGIRMVALRIDGGVRAWRSADGRSWTSLDVRGLPSSAAGAWPVMTLHLLPVGLLWLADDGSSWLGEPGA